MAPAPLNARLSRENVEAKKRFLNDKSGKTLRRVMYVTNFPTGEVWVAILGDLGGGARVGWSTPHVIVRSNDTRDGIFMPSWEPGVAQEARRGLMRVLASHTMMRGL